MIECINGIYYLELEDYAYYYKLSCDYFILNKILQDSSSAFYSSIAIARINNVKKGFKFESSVEHFDEYEIVSTIDNEEILIFEGNCLDIIGEIK